MNLHQILHCHSSAETIQMIQKPKALGNWWLTASLQQCTHSCIMSWAEIFGKTSNRSGDSAPLQPRYGALWLLAFLRTKIMFEREEISDHWWDSGKYGGAADGDWENCVRSQGAYFEGAWGVDVLCTMFLVSLIFFNKCLYFSYYMAGYFLDRPCILISASVQECAGERNFTFPSKSPRRVNSAAINCIDSAATFVCPRFHHWK